MGPKVVTPSFIPSASLAEPIAIVWYAPQDMVALQPSVFSYCQKMAAATSYYTELNNVRSRLKVFGEMHGNWDGHNAVSISPGTLLNAERYVAQLNKQTSVPEVVPNPNGTISFQWDDGDKSAELEIGKTRYSFFARDVHAKVYLADGEVTSLGNEIEGTVQALFDMDKTPSNQVSELTYNCIVWPQTE